MIDGIHKCMIELFGYSFIHSLNLSAALFVKGKSSKTKSIFFEMYETRNLFYYLVLFLGGTIYRANVMVSICAAFFLVVLNNINAKQIRPLCCVTYAGKSPTDVQ